MEFIRNFFALIGLLVVIAAGIVYGNYGQSIAQLGDEYQAYRQLDPQAGETYMNMWQRLKESGNTADATVWRIPVEPGLGVAEVEESMKMIANSRNIMFVGEQPLSQQVELMTGQKQRFLKIFQFCNPLTAVMMVDYSDAFSAYLPCRIALVEDKQGGLNLYALDMDMMIHGGHTLPPELFEETQIVKEVILAIMHGGARGDFE